MIINDYPSSTELHTYMALLKEQEFIGPQTPQPVEDVSDSSKIVTTDSETVQLYYYVGTTRTTDAGAAAGTAVVGQTTYFPIANTSGSMVGTMNDNSLTFTCLALTTEREYNWNAFDEYTKATEETILNQVTSGFANGEYCVDYKRGKIYGVKTTTASTMTSVTHKRSTAASNVTLETGDIEIGAVELKDATTDTRATIKEDNTAAGTPNVLAIGGKYNSAAQTYTDGDMAIMQMDASGNLKVTGGASSVMAEYTSPSDFTATYTSTSTITLTGVPVSIADKSQIVYVKQTLTGNTAVTFVAGANGVAFGYSGGVITIYQYGSAISTLAATDVYEVGVNAQRKAFDATTETLKTSEQAPLWTRYVADSLLDTTNIAAATNYYPSSTGASMEGYKNMSLTGKFIDADGTMTLTVEGTNDEDTTNADWIQVYGFDTKNNTTATSWTVTNGTLTFAIDFESFDFTYFRVVMVNSGATNTGIIKLNRKAI